MAVAAKLEAYTATVRSFVQSGGVVFVLSADPAVAGVLREVLDMARAPRTALRLFRQMDGFLVELREEGHRRVVVFLERVLAGQSLAPLLGSIGQICAEAIIIVLTSEIDQDTAVLLIEYGAHNILTKPISVATVMEKIAISLAPQGQMGRYVDRARRSLEMGSYEEALRIASLILQLKPEGAVAYTIMGDAYKGMGMASRAEEMYLKASEVQNLYLQPLKRLSSLYEEVGDKRKQLDTLKRLHALSPLNTQRLLEMGSLEIEVGDPDQAVVYFDQAMQTARREAAEHLSRLSAKIAEACVGYKPDLAVRYSRLALDVKGDQLSSADVETINLLGLALRRQGRWREAVLEYRRALAVHPAHPAVLYNMALAYAEGGEYDLAAQALEQALAVDADLPRASDHVATSMRTIFTRARRPLPEVLVAEGRGTEQPVPSPEIVESLR